MSSGAACEEVKADSLLPGETADLKSEIIECLGDDWLHAKNVMLGLRSPGDLIGTEDEACLRDLLRSISVSALS